MMNKLNFLTINHLLCLCLLIIPIGLHAQCAVTTSSSSGAITINGLTTDANTKLFDSNISSVWECNPWNGNSCTSNEVVSNLTVGATYFLSVQSDNCSEWIPIVVQGGGGNCPDSDADGTCDQDDCAPNDPGFPVTPGTACNDGTDTTTNDQIQSDGCTCEGTPVDVNNRPDLTVTEIFYNSGTIREGISQWFTYKLNNIGTADAAADYIVRVYLTQEPNVTGSNSVIVGETLTGYTPAGSSTLVTEGFTIPDELLYERYYLTLRVDATFQISEDKEYNNMVSTGQLVNTDFSSGIQIISCEDHIMSGNYANTGDNITWPTPAITTNCNQPGFTTTQVSGPTMDSFQAPGTYAIGYEYTDGCGNYETCNFNVTIQEISPDCAQQVINSGSIDCSEYLADGTYRVVLNNDNALTEYIYGTDGQLQSSQGLGIAVTATYDVESGNIVTRDGQDNITNSIALPANLSQQYDGFTEVLIQPNGYIFGASNFTPSPNQTFSLYLVKTDLSGNILSEQLVETGENFQYTSAFITEIIELSNGKYAVTYTYPSGNEPYGAYIGVYAVFDESLQILHQDNVLSLNYATKSITPELRQTACGTFYMVSGSFRQSPAGPSNTIAYSNSGYYNFDGTQLNVQKSYQDNEQNYYHTAVNTGYDKFVRSIDTETPQGDQLTVETEYLFDYFQYLHPDSEDSNNNIIFLEHTSNGEVIWSAELFPGTSYTFEEFILLGDRHYLLGTENDLTYLVDVDCLNGTTPPVTGCNVNITTANGGVTITGLPADANTKLFDTNFTAAFECNPWNGNTCSGLETVSGLTTGATYYLSVQSADCDLWIPVVIQGSGGCPDSDGDGICNADDCEPNNPSLPTAPGDACNDFDMNTENDVIQSDGCTCAGTPVDNGGVCNINVTQSNGTVTITGLTGAENSKLFDSTVSSSGIVWECDPWNGSPCTGTATVSGLNAGENYFLSVQSDNCDEWIPITIQGSAMNGDLSSRNAIATEDKFAITNLFPNPTHNEAFVKIESSYDGNFRLEIYDILGTLKTTKQVNLETGLNTIQLDIDRLNAGTYNLILRNKKNEMKQTRFIKI